MGYDFTPVNADAESFHFGAFSWPVLLEQFGYLFSAVQGRGWCMAPGLDERMGDDYPRIISNDGFLVTEEEAKIMARMARNFVAIQRSLPEANGADVPLSTPAYLVPWPRKIRDDFVDKFAKFADWAEKSGGFEIW